MAFIRIAIQKLNTLTRKSSFIGFISIDDDSVVLDFTDATCVINSFGKVDWEYKKCS